MAAEVAAEEVAKRLGYKYGLRDLQWQIVVGQAGRWSRCFWDSACWLWKFLSGLCITIDIRDWKHNARVMGIT